ncbi:TonB-dependent siderophore receptor, partial [Klebsiella pneumoniae]
ISLPFELGANQSATLGTEWNRQRMKDPSSTTQSASNGAVPGIASTGRSPYAQAEIFSLFAGDNMELTDSTMLPPARR